MAIQPLSIDANTRQGITPPITEKQIHFFFRIIIHSAQLSISDTATDTHIIVGAGLELKYEGVVPYLVAHQNLPSNMHINGPREELIGAQEPCALRQPRSVENSMAGAIYDVKRKGEITSYYFSQPRPPEHTYVNRYRPWKYASLKACGWGPPLTHASISVSIWSPNIIC
jgi:hypothetical protein